MVLFCKLCMARMKRTVLLFARIRMEWVMAFVPCDFTPRRSALSLIPVAQKIMFLPLARSSAGINAVEIFLVSVVDQFFALFLVARPHLALHVAAKALDSRRRQHRFGRAADSHVKIELLSGRDGRHGCGDVAVADHAQRRAGSANLFDDFLVRGRSSIMTTTS